MSDSSENHAHGSSVSTQDDHSFTEMSTITVSHAVAHQRDADTSTSTQPVDRTFEFITSLALDAKIAADEQQHLLHPNDADDAFSLPSDDDEGIHPSKPNPLYDFSMMDDVDQRNLYISGLPVSVTEPQLHKMFEPFGTVSSLKLMLNIHTGLSRGFAFVLYADNEAAHKAVAEMDHRTIDGQRLTVRFAEKRARLCGLPTKKIFIRNIPIGVTERDIRALFEPKFAIVQLSMRPDPYRPSGRQLDGNKAPNVAHVIFETFEAAGQAATAVHNTFPWPQCTVPLLAKVVDTGVRAKKEAKAQTSRSSGSSASFSTSTPSLVVTAGQSLSPSQSFQPLPGPSRIKGHPVFVNPPPWSMPPQQAPVMMQQPLMYAPQQQMPYYPAHPQMMWTPNGPMAVPQGGPAMMPAPYFVPSQLGEGMTQQQLYFVTGNPPSANTFQPMQQMFR